MTSALRCVLIAVLSLMPHALQAQSAPTRNILTGWPAVIDAVRDGAGYTLLGSHRNIEVSFIMANDSSSPDSVMLDAGFFRGIDLTLLDETTGQVVAAVNEWHGTGSCAGVPDCLIDSEIVLGPGFVATFVAVLSTGDRQPLAEGQYMLRVELGAARQRIRAPNGSQWPGRVGASGRIPVAVRPVRDEADLRSVDIIQASAAVRRNDHAEALAIYQGMIARDPMDAVAHMWAGFALMELRRLPEAAAAYERALANQPSGEYLAVPQILAAVYFALREEANALAMLERYVPPHRRQAVEQESRQGGARLRMLP